MGPKCTYAHGTEDLRGGHGKAYGKGGYRRNAAE